jgi:hypothetical protein|tara:strand:+ start:639 stop:1040 length:402 start_codon:yes stop_codon:yes gene_type:complete
MRSILYKPDTIGSLASTLCLIHCIATPFLFITQACTLTCCSDAPTWWQSLDYIFLIISFFAIYQATKTSSNKLIKYALWLAWLLFFICIMNKTIGVFYISQNVTYGIGITLAVLHLYNLKFCQCENQECCTNK